MVPADELRLDRAEPAAGFDRDDLAAVGEKVAGGLAGAGPDLQYPGAGSQPAPVGQRAVSQSRWVAMNSSVTPSPPETATGQPVHERRVPAWPSGCGPA